MPHTQRASALDVGLLVIRVAVGIVFMYHGGQKLFGLFDGPGISGFAGMLDKLGVPAPTVSAVLAGLAEFVGGLAVLLGLFIRVSVVPMIFVMVVAVTKVHNKAFSLQHGGMEYALTLGLVLLGLGLTGAGLLSVDGLRSRRAKRVPAADQGITS